MSGQAGKGDSAVTTPLLTFINRSRKPSDAIQLHRCTRCHDAHFRNVAQLHIHQQTCKSYHCTVCKKTFRSEETFDKHLRSNCPPKRFPCNQCHKPYSRKSDRDKHVKTCSQHSAQKCPKCGCLFLTRRQLDLHADQCSASARKDNDSAPEQV